MIPVGTSVNPGELRSGSKWDKTFILCLGVTDTPPGTHIVYICPFFGDKWRYFPKQFFHFLKVQTIHSSKSISEMSQVRVQSVKLTLFLTF